MIAKADVLIQNLAPGAAERAGFGSAAMRAKHKRLITVDISGYGEHGPYRNRRAYDLLVQAESGLASITGTAEGPGRVGISATDIGTGMYAHAAVLEALLARQKTGEGRAIAVSLFSAMAEWMTVPVLAKDYSDYDWPRLGLTHPFIAPYGVYQTADKVPVLISIQNDREFERLCHGVLDRPGLEKDPDYATNKARNARRDDTNAIVQKSFGSQSFADLAARLDAAQIAWARVSSVDDLSSHPQLRRVSFGTTVGDVSMPALAASWNGEPERLGDVPTVGQHSEQVRREFARLMARLLDGHPAFRLRRSVLLRRRCLHELLAGVAARPRSRGRRDRHPVHEPPDHERRVDAHDRLAGASHRRHARPHPGAGESPPSC